MKVVKRMTPGSSHHKENIFFLFLLFLRICMRSWMFTKLMW